jgi:mRNA interferase HigB
MAAMHVISRKALRDFAERHAGAEGALDTWTESRKQLPGPRSTMFARRILTPNFVSPYTVFNIKGNTCRLVSIVKSQHQRIRIKHVLTHAEYDKGKWK